MLATVGDDMGSVDWLVYCSSMVKQIAGLEGRGLPAGYNYEHVYRACGLSPRARRSTPR